MISIIMTVYNGRAFLEEAFNSILGQSYKNYEILFVDDGSIDGSHELLKSFTMRYPEKCILLTHEGRVNRGIVSSYNLGISKAKGEYIAFLEQDDVWHSNFLDEKVRVFKQFPEVGLVFSPYKVVSDGLYGIDMMLRQFFYRRFIPVGRPYNAFPQVVKANCIATFSSMVLKKELLKEVDSVAPEIIAYDWWIVASLAAKSLFYYDRKSQIHWRWHKESTTGRQTFKSFRRTGLGFMSEMYKMLEIKSEEFSAENRRTFQESNASFPYFHNYYNSPDASSFLGLFSRSPLWALGSSASLYFNWLRHRR